jgi:3'(2'), 5'-bisphosphate nucleotidase
MNYFNQKEIETIISLALQAGEIAAQSFKKKDFTISRKIDNSEVTSVDHKISEFLEQKLSKEFPHLPIISEEGQLRAISGETFWLIDPIDGTSSFAYGTDQFSVNIALIKNRKPVFGIIYAPLFESGKLAYTNHQSQVVMIKNQQEYLLNTKPKNLDFSTQKLKIVTSIRTSDSQILTYLNQHHKEFAANCKIEKLSSAIKFFRILENESDLYIHLRKTMEWDTAAGQALIEAAHGEVKNLNLNDKNIPSTNLAYKKTDFANGAFIVYNQSLKPFLN